jgi:hypothetical protein
MATAMPFPAYKSRNAGASRRSPPPENGDTSLKPWLRRTLVVAALIAGGALAFDVVQGMVNVPRAENFTATTLSGKEWRLADHLGKRPVVLSFFATW